MTRHPAIDRTLRVAACLALAGAVLVTCPAPEPARTGLALFTLIGALWLTQALPLAVTALLVPPLAALAGLVDLRQGFAPFAHPVIFLFLGGFALAAALHRQGLDRRLAQALLRLSGGHRLRAVALLFGGTALLSMWISNTATAALMLPLALGLLDLDRPSTAHPVGAPARPARAEPADAADHADRADHVDHAAPARAAAPADQAADRTQVFVLLGVAYSASIGGIGTLVGSPPNAIAAAQAGIGFVDWMGFGLPLVALLLPLMAGLLWLTLRPRVAGRVALPPPPPRWTRAERLTALVFGLTALGWVGAAPLAAALGLGGDTDTLVAVLALAALIALGLLDWDELERSTHWSVLLLFGGGLALSQVLERSGGSRWLADMLVLQLQGAPAWLVLLAVTGFVVMLTELVSNTAAAALLVPVFIGVGQALGLPPALLASAIAAAASCAFMLPVATPPNAIVHGTGRVPPSAMLRAGLVLNIACTLVITGLAAWRWG